MFLATITTCLYSCFRNAELSLKTQTIISCYYETKSTLLSFSLFWLERITTRLWKNRVFRLPKTIKAEMKAIPPFIWLVFQTYVDHTNIMVNLLGHIFSYLPSQLRPLRVVRSERKHMMCLCVKCAQRKQSKHLD